ncbi:FtsX-like permease family protein [Glaciihabitans sp. dw_435]|uniref:FtsX-like permease family protein n=1 Tax=Glaciihabitans sp. dw_435 TaxID=2720081 RepID=UPI001BD5192E|nr:FtsX-like permease family protein [Glaciihabitans sp. dw_435]
MSRTRSGLGGWRLASRSLRAFWAAGLMIAIVTVVMSALATAVPRSIEGFLTAGVQYDSRAAAVVDRDISATFVGVYATGTASDPATVADMSAESAAAWGSYDDQVAAIRASMPAAVRNVVADGQYSAVTDYSAVKTETSLGASVALGYDPRLVDHIRLVEGTMPTVIPQILPGDVTLDFIASQSVVSRVRWPIGEVRPMSFPDGNSQNVRLVGIFEPKDADDPYWTHTPSALVPPAISMDDVKVTVFPNAGGISAALNSSRIVRTQTWFQVDSSKLTSAAAANVAQQVRKFTSVSHAFGDVPGQTLAFRSDLPRVLESAVARNVSSQAVLATIIAGPLGVAIAIEVLIARLALARVGRPLLLLGARGASAGQRQLFVVLPALAVGIPFAAVGALAGIVATPGASTSGAAIGLVVAVALAPAILLAAVSATASRRESAGTTTARIRMTAEIIVAVAALAAVTVLVQRGATASASGGVDLLSALTPLLLSLLGCVAVLRLYPVILRRSVAASRRRRGISAFFGTIVAHRGSPAGLIPVLAVVVGISVAVFSGVLASTLSTGLATAAHARIGADASIAGIQISPDQVDELRAVPGMAAVAMVTLNVLPISSTESDTVQATVVLVDRDDLRAVQRGVPGAIDWNLLPETDTGGDSALPVLASSSAVTALKGNLPSDVNGTAVTSRALPPTDRVFGTGDNWILADQSAADAFEFPLPLFGDSVLLRADASTTIAALTPAIRAIVGPDATITTPASAGAALSDNPAVGGIHTSVLLSVAGAGLLSATALILTTALDSRGRRRTLGVLATLGMNRRQARSAVAWELGPLSVVGLVVGLLLGAVLSVVVLTSVDLRPFTAGLVQPGTSIDPVLTTLVVGGFGVLVVATTVIAAWRATPRPGTTRTTPAEEGWNS